MRKYMLVVLACFLVWTSCNSPSTKVGPQVLGPTEEALESGKSLAVTQSTNCNCQEFIAKRGYCVAYINDYHLRPNGYKTINKDAHLWPVTSKEARTGSVAVFTGRIANGYGHVAWVVEVVPGGFTAKHFNWGGYSRGGGVFVGETEQHFNLRKCCAATDAFGIEGTKTFYYRDYPMGDKLKGFLYPESDPETANPRSSVTVVASLDGKSWDGSVNCGLSGPNASYQVKEVPKTFSNMPVGGYSLNCVSGPGDVVGLQAKYLRADDSITLEAAFRSKSNVCSASVGSCPTPTPRPTIAPTITPVPTAIPTSTPRPSVTTAPAPVPTSTPKPTATPVPQPTSTPVPTATPNPPSACNRNPPSPGFSGIGPGSVVSGTLNFECTIPSEYSACPGSYASVYTLCDGKILGQDASSPYQFSWNTRTVPNGPCLLQCNFITKDGVYGTGNVIEVTVKN